jgi:hypothetical protein
MLRNQTLETRGSRTRQSVQQQRSGKLQQSNWQAHASSTRPLGTGQTVLSEASGPPIDFVEFQQLSFCDVWLKGPQKLNVPNNFLRCLFNTKKELLSRGVVDSIRPVNDLLRGSLGNK